MSFSDNNNTLNDADAEMLDAFLATFSPRPSPPPPVIEEVIPPATPHMVPSFAFALPPLPPSLSSIGDSKESPPPSSPTTIDEMSTFFDFAKLSPEQQTRVVRLRNDINEAWDINAPSTAFPVKYHPDPDSRNWGVELLSALKTLAQLAGEKYEAAGVHYVERSIEDRNAGLDSSSGRARFMGDFVIRLVDVEVAIGKMRALLRDSWVAPRPGDTYVPATRTDSYIPGYSYRPGGEDGEEHQG